MTHQPGVYVPLRALFLVTTSFAFVVWNHFFYLSFNILAHISELIRVLSALKKVSVLGYLFSARQILSALATYKNKIGVLVGFTSHEVVKLFSISTQLSMKFILFMNVKMPTIAIDIYEQDK